MKRSKEQQEKIAQKIREKRKALKMQQQELARKAYISKSDMCKIEKAQKWVESDELRRIAAALGVDTDWLLGTLDHETKEKTDVAEVLPLDSEAIGLLLDLKKSCANSKEAEYIADLISFFIKALLGDICGDDGISLGVALAELSHFYAEEQFLENEKIEDLFSHESRMLRTSIIACKEEVREAATKVLTQFCKDRPFESAQAHNEPVVTLPLDVFNEMIQSEMLNAYLDDDVDRIEELKKSGKAFNLKWEVEENGNI